MNNISDLNTNQSSEDSNINIRDLVSSMLTKWHWFAISILTCLIIAFLYSRYSPPVYSVNAKILVNDDEKGGGLGKQAGALMDLGGILGSKSSVDNEAEILKTRFLMEQVVRDMQLNIVYSKKSNLVSRELYDSPFKLNIINGVDTIYKTKLEVRKVSGSKILVVAENFEKEVLWGEQFRIKNIGVIKLDPLDLTKMSDDPYYVSVSSIDDRVAELSNNLNVSVTNKQVSIIDLSLSYSLPRKGEDILNKLISKYTSSNLNDKNVIADSTYKFIKERLNSIASELGDVENEVENFKQKNQLADMSEQGRQLVQNTGEFTIELAKAETQVNVLNDLERYLVDENSNKRVFPSSLMPQDLVFSNLMNQYNALLVERERQLLSVTEESPFIQNIDKQIAGLRGDILSNIRTTKNSYVRTRNKLRTQLSSAEGQISGVPVIEKNYLKLARNQKIKQELYIFLMQKAEETVISKSSNISIAKVIDPPKSQVNPISPKKNIIYFSGLIVGLLIPIVILLASNLFNVTISSKQDISNLTAVPIIGEISHNSEADNLIVANKGRSSISEQFRALRTNLSFYLKNSDEKIILLTSSMSGEGKSFTAINLGNILALAGKKVLLMELDLRKPGLSAKLNISNEVGFSNYTIDKGIKIEDIVKPLSISKNMYIISSGPLPPNPAETLMSEYTPVLMKELKEQFDYIIMDAPPVGIITDAQLLSVYADVTLYIVRQRVTLKDQLKIVDDLYKTGKMKNIGIVVNDILSKQYGYGYGYGTYGINEDKPSFLQTVKDKFKLG